MIKIYSKENQGLQLLEFQGEFENFDLFDGELDQSTLQMKFKNFYLQGEKISKSFTLYEKEENGDISEVRKITEVILFKTPQRFFNNKNPLI